MQAPFLANSFRNSSSMSGAVATDAHWWSEAQSVRWQVQTSVPDTRSPERWHRGSDVPATSLSKTFPGHSVLGSKPRGTYCRRG